jgi:hypothetical protein
MGPTSDIHELNEDLHPAISPPGSSPTIAGLSLFTVGSYLGRRTGYNPRVRRDMDLVRKILLALEEHEHGFGPNPLIVEGYSAEQIGYHIHLMAQGELVIGLDDTTFGAQSPKAIASSVTWKGHEFLDASREPSMWNRAKGLAGRAGNSSFTVLLETLTRTALKQIEI